MVSKNKDLLDIYKSERFNRETNNIFSYFIEKCFELGEVVSLIVPKSLLNAPEFNMTRDFLLKYDLQKVCDYGEKAFKGVKIETISFLCDSNAIPGAGVIIESYIRNTYRLEEKDYIFSKDFPYWLIYRNESFDKVVSKMKLGIFKSWRDRQITKSVTREVGEVKGVEIA